MFKKAGGRMTKEIFKKLMDDQEEKARLEKAERDQYMLLHNYIDKY